jgi:hypothetical protein
MQCIEMIPRISAMAKKVEMLSTKLASNGISPKHYDRCPFSLFFFQDDRGYYIKLTTAGWNPPVPSPSGFSSCLQLSSKRRGT